MSDGKRLLASIIRTGGVETLRKLRDDMFTEDELPVYEFIINHFMSFDQIPDVETVRNETGKRLPRDCTSPPEFYLDKIEERGIYNKFAPVAEELLRKLKRKDVKEIPEFLRAALQQVQTHNKKLVPLGESLASVVEQVRDTRFLGGLPGIPTGWPSLDEDSGGYSNGDMITWVARTGQGKTWMLLHQAYHARLSGRTVLFVSMEMPTHAIARRFLSYVSGVDSKAMRLGQVSNWSMSRFETALEAYEQDTRMVFMSNDFSGDVGEVEIAAKEVNADIIFIDSFYLLSPMKDSTRRASSKTERAGYLCDDVKSMALRIDRPVVVSTQFNRESGAGGKKGSLETVGFTEAINANSSLIYGILPGQSSEGLDRRIETMKGREGETQAVLINYKFSPVDFTEIGYYRPSGELIADDESSEYFQNALERMT